MEYIVYGYSLLGNIVKLKSFKSYSAADKYAKRVYEDSDELVFIRERQSYDHDVDFHSYRFRRG